MDQGTVFDIMRFSTRDGPGIRTTVFFKGCPLACQWCHNPESQNITPELMLRPNLCIGCLACIEACPQGAITFLDGEVRTDRTRCKICGLCAQVCYAEAREIVGQGMSISQVMEEVLKDVPFYEESGGGLTFSGGEALMQPGFLFALLQECKRQNLHTALDTCGFAPWPVLDKIRAYVDLFLYDLKLISEDAHRAYTGVSNRLILSNLRQLSNLGHSIVIRVPVIPGINDTEQALGELRDILSALPHIEHLELLPYHPAGVEKYRRLDRPYRLAVLATPSAQRMDWIADRLRGAGIPVLSGG